ncbi:MAG TPA: TonB-dependent receptor [Bryobacteraceae bacterium]|nr:TonB-dependent receptor [Bryobacteraceae bacterium]
MASVRLSSWLCGAILSSLVLGTAFGQTNGELKLTVKDPSGAAVDASGKLENISSGASRKFQTSNGAADLTDIAPGRYRLELTQSGFATWDGAIDVTPGNTVTRNITLSIVASSTKLDVVEATPLAGFDVPASKIPAPVQSVTSQDLQQSGALDLSDYLNKRLAGVNVNESQENPYQPDVNYRGYTASPLLGTPEGISVYFDSVRVNQPFGDVVSWDLIPKVAIDETTLMPGSNPLFGLNTLGGALAIETKDGNSAPGGSVTVTGGSFGRRALEFEYGGSNKHAFNWYVAGNTFYDDGWRPLSPSGVNQLFSHVGWQTSTTTIGLDVAYAYNDLKGVGPQDQRLLNSLGYSSGYTLTDETFDRSPFLNLRLRHAAGTHLTLSGNAYFRNVNSYTFNSDFNSDALEESIYQPSAADQAALTAAGYTGFPTSGANASNTPFPSWRCIAQALQLAEAAEKCDAFQTRSWTNQNNYGVAGQLTYSSGGAANRNQFTAGFAVDHSDLSFIQNQQFAYLNPDRTTTGISAWADGSTNVDGTPFDTRVNLDGTPTTGSLFLADTLTAGKFSFTGSGRYNHTTSNNVDLLVPIGGPGSLTAKNTFQRFNPAVGMTFAPVSAFNVYFGYTESNRAPTSIELGCADPNNPCHLPNSLVSDPPLKQVVAHTLEAGIRSSAEKRLNWGFSWYRALNTDDLLFVSSPQANNGYFRNFGETLREGVTVDVSERIGKFEIGGDYTYIEATYQSSETIDGAANSTNDSGIPGIDGNIQIVPGDHIPDIPDHVLKAYAGWKPNKRFFIELLLNAQTKSFARGNENNLDKPDNVYYFGNGVAPGFATLGLASHYQVNRHLQMFAQIDNLTDRHYFTAAQLAVTGFTTQGTLMARPFPPDANGDYPLVYSTFLSPGAPITVSGGLKWTF